MTKLIFCVITVASAAWPQGRYPVPAESFQYAGEIAKSRALVADLVKAKHIPGLSVAVAHAGTIVWSEGFGFADLEQRFPATPQTRFRLGSVSKLITAAAVARLVEEGKLDLDAPIQQYVPGFPEKPWRATARQLAGHTAGIRHYRDSDFTGPLKDSPHFHSMGSSLAIFKDDPLLFEPGTGYSYSTYGWTLMSAVVEGAAKQEFLSYVRRAVLEPLGLRSIAADHVDAIVPLRTRFYAVDKAGELKNAPYVDSSYKWGGGGFLASAEDLARFGSAHLQPGFFRQSTLDLLFTPQSLKSGKSTGVGIGWRIGTDSHGRRVLHHGGTIDGGRAMLMMYPDSKLVVVLLANLLADFGEKEAQQIGDFWIQQ